MKKQYDLPLGPKSEIELCRIFNFNSDEIYT